MTTTLLHSGQFSRRVLFSNVHPELNDTPIRAIYNLPLPSNGSGNGHIEFNEMMFNSFPGAKLRSKEPPAKHVLTPRRKRLKLPDPPLKLILKNKVSPEQLAINEKTIQFHGDLDEIILQNNREVTQTETPQPRRKLYADMTDEELMQLDPQFATSKAGNVDGYKFGSIYTYHGSDSLRRPLMVVPAPCNPYASTGENNYKLVLLTVKHNDYDNDCISRTVLAFISGRRHSWNSIDWLVGHDSDILDKESFLAHGDCLVVGALVPRRFISDHNKINKQAAMEEILYNKATSILDTVLASPLLQKDLKLKVTVELILDHVEDTNVSGNKYALAHLFKQYHPNLVVMGTKLANFNFKYPCQRGSVRDEYLIKLASYIMKYSEVPTILVGPSTKWHNIPPVEKRRNLLLKFIDDPHRLELISLAELCVLTELFRGPQELAKQLEDIWSVGDSSRFADVLAAISDRSSTDATNYLQAINSKDDSIKIDLRIHSIYRSQSGYGAGIGMTRLHSRLRDSVEFTDVYKVKLLLADPEPKKEARSLLLPLTTLTPADMKKRSNLATLASSGEKEKEKEKEKDEGKRRSIWKKLGFKK